MNDTMMNEILKRLDVLGEKVGAGAQFAWATMLRQAFWVDGVMAIVIGLVLAVGVYGAYRIARFAIEQTEEDALSPWFLVAIFAVLGMIGLCSASVVMIVDGVNHVANPQYYALLDLARMLGK